MEKISSGIEREDLDFTRGAEDIVFVNLEGVVDTNEISEMERPRDELEEKMKEEGLEWENARIIGLFSSEFPLQLQDDARITVDGEQVYPD